jgi:hypothetical protein
MALQIFVQNKWKPVWIKNGSASWINNGGFNSCEILMNCLRQYLSLFQQSKQID